MLPICTDLETKRNSTVVDNCGKVEDVIHGEGHFVASCISSDKYQNMTVGEASASKPKLQLRGVEKASANAAGKSGIPGPVNTEHPAISNETLSSFAKIATASCLYSNDSEVELGTLEPALTSPCDFKVEIPSVTAITEEDKVISWDEKGKGPVSSCTPVQISRRRSFSQFSSRTSSPALTADIPSRASSPWKSSVCLSSAASVPVPPYDVGAQANSVIENLSSQSTESQLRALKRLRKDYALCKILAESERGLPVLVKLLSSSKGWLPTLGNSDVQTNAAAALLSIVTVSKIFKKIIELDVIPQLINLLKTGSVESQSTAAKIMAKLADEPSCSYEIGQAGGCQSLIAILPSATAVDSSYIKLQMASDNADVQAAAMLALSKLAISSANQQRMIDGGIINTLRDCLAHGLSSLLPSTGECLYKLAADEDYRSMIVNSGSLNLLLDILQNDKCDVPSKAAAAQAVGMLVQDERIASQAIPLLASFLSCKILKLELAAVTALADLAHRSKFFRTKIAEESGCIPAVLKLLVNADIQLNLTMQFEMRSSRSSPVPLVTRLRDSLGELGFRCLHRFANQVGIPLTNNINGNHLVQALRSNAHDQQFAVVRLLNSLSLRGFSQTKILMAGEDGLKFLSRLIMSDVLAIKVKAISALGNLASVRPEIICSVINFRALLSAVKVDEAKVFSLRCILNISTDDEVVDTLLSYGISDVILLELDHPNVDVQWLVANILANMASNSLFRQMFFVSEGLDILLKKLSDDNDKIKGAAALALWQLIDESRSIRVNEAVGSLGGIEASLNALSSNSIELQENVMGLLDCLARSRCNVDKLVEEGAAGHMLLMLGSTSTEIQGHAASVLWRIAETNERNCNLIVGPSGDSVSRLIRLLASSNSFVQTSAAGCIGALAYSTDLAERLWDSDVVAPLIKVLWNGCSSGKSSAVRALTKLAELSVDACEEFLDLGGYELCMQLLQTSNLSKMPFTNLEGKFDVSLSDECES